MAASVPRDELLTPRQAARKLRVSIDTLKRWRQLGVGPKHVKLGRGIRYPVHQIETHLAENLRASTHG
jgi:predicted site-specific integrase-resolvase